MDVLLIPGFMLDADLWREVRPAVDRMGRVIDADTTRDDTIAAMAARALDQLDGPALVIGFSMGGYIAREMLYQQPAKVSALVLVATSSRAKSGPSASIDPARFRHLGRAAVARSLHPDHQTDALIERVQAMSRRLGGAVYARQSELSRQGDTDQLGCIACPTLIVAADQDALRSVAESAALHRGINSSTLAVIERSGHLIPLEQPRKFESVLTDWLSKLTASPTRHS